MRDQVAAQIIYGSDRNQGASGLSPKDADVAVDYAMADLCPGAVPN